MTRLNNIIPLVLLIFANCFFANAQSFSEKAKIETAPTTGYYAIIVTPEISGYVSTDFKDIRIVTDVNEYQPFIIRPTAKKYSTQNENLPILKNNIDDRGKSELIIENKNKELISSIALLIRNAAVSRSATITGSDDSIHWYAIADNIVLEKNFEADSDRFIQYLNFPGSTYKYLQLKIENGKNAPLNILKAEQLLNPEYRSANPYISNPHPKFIQTDSSDGATYIHIINNARYHIDNIRMTLKGPQFFKRNIDLILKNNITLGFTISSDTVFNFYIPVFNDSDFILKIYNGDNPPLKIEDITTAQLSKQLVFYAEQGKQYFMLMHDSLATLPDYDLKDFTDSISRNLQVLQVSQFSKQNNNEPGSLQTQTYWLWILIGLVLTVLIFFTAKLVREMEKK